VSALILVAEDDENQAELVRRYLEQDHHRVVVVHDGREALDVVRATQPELVVLDLMLPGLGGLDVCRALRAGSDVLVLMLTARSTEDDLLHGLGIGADDYMTKPFSLEELVARLRGLLRRSSHLAPPADESLKVGDLKLDAASREVTRGGTPMSLSSTEFELLRFLMRNPRRALSRTEILDRVWNYDFAGRTSIVDLYISYLRKKIDADREPMIHTVRGIGYMLRPPE
jgi:two-component system, OmpR family, response regulator TrcR